LPVLPPSTPPAEEKPPSPPPPAVNLLPILPTPVVPQTSPSPVTVAPPLSTSSSSSRVEGASAPPPPRPEPLTPQISRAEPRPEPPAPPPARVEPPPPPPVARVEPPPAPPAASPPPAPLAPTPLVRPQASLNSAAVDRLILRGDEVMRSGDPVAARLLYELAANNGSAAAATAVGRTWDPVEHQRLGIQGTIASAPRALEWYRKGAAGGDANAETQMRALSAWVARNPQR
jgi:hypothetical protein